MEKTEQSTIKIIRPEFSLFGTKRNDLIIDGEQQSPWPVSKSGIPNKMLRNALFGIQRERNSFNHNEELVFKCPGEIVLKYSGPELNQDDSVVWQMIVRAVRQNHVPMGSLIQLSTQDMLSALGRSDGGINFKWLKSCMDRLSSALIHIDTPNDETKTYLLVGYKIDKKTKKIYVGISAFLYPLFIGDLTDIDLIRKATLKSQLARWLHDFYSSHSNPFPYSLEKIKELSRSNKQNSKFKIMIKEAIEELKTCEPPLFSKESFFDDNTNNLIIYKATNSPGSPPVKQESIISTEQNTKRKRKKEDIENIMQEFNLTKNQVVAMDDKRYESLLNSNNNILAL